MWHVEVHRQACRKSGYVVDDFYFEKPERPVQERPKRPPRPRSELKPITYPIIHADLRHGPGWPREPGRVPKWTGWLTYREYNLIEDALRYQTTDLYRIGETMGLMMSSTQRMYHSMINAGLITGVVDEFELTPMAKILFDMTEQFILQLDLGEEEAV